MKYTKEFNNRGVAIFAKAFMGIPANKRSTKTVTLI